MAARDARHQVLERALSHCARSTLTLALNLPGTDKIPPGARPLFDWARKQIRSSFSELSLFHSSIDVLGPFAILTGSVEASQLKSWSIDLESQFPASRLLDLDVFDSSGKPMDRSRLNHSQRPCLVCACPAKECIRTTRHTPEELQEAVHALLQPFAN